MRWATDPWLGDHQPWFTFYLAVALTTWWWGWKPGVLTGLLGLGGGIWFILPPRGDLFVTRADSWVHVFTYLGVASALIVWLGKARLAHRETESTKEALQEAVQLLDLGSGMVLDMEGIIRRWNTGSERLYGYTAAQALGRKSHDLLSTRFPVLREQVRTELLERGCWRGELTQRRADGQEIVVASEWVLQRNAAGQPQAILEVNNDITTLKRAERALADQNRRLDLMTQAASALLSAPDPDWAVTGFHQRISECFQTGLFFEFEVSEDGQALDLKACWGPANIKERCGVRRLKVGEGILGKAALERKAIVRSHILESTESDEEYLRALGVKSYACFPLVVGERLLGTLSFASVERQEFTESEQEFLGTLAGNVALAKERRRLNRELEKRTSDLESTVRERTAKLHEMMAELRQMSYSMVHEMRAPLRAIISFVQLLQQETGERLEPDARDYLSRIQTSAARMDLLVTDALNYNKVLRERLPLEPVDPGYVLCDLVSTLEEFQPPRAQVQLKGPFPKVRANKGLLSQCFSHLLRNAVTYVQPGTGPRVEVSAHASDGRVLLTFADNGVGIPKELQQRIFELFESGHLLTSEGRGVGLALVRKMIERMHGRVWVESEVGQGSRFCLELQAAA